MANIGSEIERTVTMYPVIKNYSIVREIGSGAMGAVYEAVDRRKQRTVALKVLDPNRSKKAASGSFLGEVRAATKINHPNVVHILDYGAVENTHFIVMEFVPGTTMQRVLKVRGAVRPTMTVEIMHQIAEGLSQAHQLDIIHRNIKPANILLHKQGKVMLSDFDFFHHTPDPRMSADAGVARQFSCMSPEQIAGKTATAASDVYSWAVCFYTFLTGKLPYRTQQLPELIEEIRTAAASPDPLLMTSLPAPYADILSQCLAADPGKRIPNAVDLVRHFEFLKRERIPSADLRSLCGDIAEEYDAPKQSPSRAHPARGNGKRFSLRRVSVAATSVAIVAVAAAIALHYFQRPGRIAPASELTAAVAVKPSPASQNQAKVSPGKSEKPSSLIGQKPPSNSVATLPAALVIPPSDDSAPRQALTHTQVDSSQALLDSFNVLSPESTREAGLKRGDSAPSLREDSTAVKQAAPVDSGGLFVSSDPWATVFIDGREIGTTPFEDPVSLPAGVHVLKLTSNNYSAVTDTVAVTVDSILRKRYKLEVKR
jgi:serine/threonine protein kinase